MWVWVCLSVCLSVCTYGTARHGAASLVVVVIKIKIKIKWGISVSVSVYRMMATSSFLGSSEVEAPFSLFACSLPRLCRAISIAVKMKIGVMEVKYLGCTHAPDTSPSHFPPPPPLTPLTPLASIININISSHGPDGAHGNRLRPSAMNGHGQPHPAPVPAPVGRMTID